MAQSLLFVFLPLGHHPAVFVARVSFLFRGMGSGIGIGPVQTSHYWLREARSALRKG